MSALRSVPWVALCVACGSNDALFVGSPDAANGGSGGWSNGSSGGTPATGGAAQPPQPAAPCGDDLNVSNGTVLTDYGLVPEPTAFTGDPAATGSQTFVVQPVTVPIAAETFEGAGLTITITAGQLVGTAWSPSGSGPHPLVVMLPGFATSYTTYTPYAEHLATHGFFVLGVDTRSNAFVASHDQEALEVVRTIDWLTTVSPLKSGIDATKIAVAGHSKGGKLSFFAAALDPRIDLVIGWDPVNAGGGPCAFDPNCDAMPVAPNCRAMASGLQSFMHAETLVIGAPPDAALNPEPDHNAVNFYRGAPSPAGLVMLNTGHIAWASGASEADVFRVTKRVHTGKLLQRFRGMRGLEDDVPASPEVASDPKVIQVEAK